MAWKPQKLSGIITVSLSLLWAGAPPRAEPPLEPAARRGEYQRPPAIPFPSDNIYSPAKARLGRMLFFEPLLSGSRTRSCASCHNPALSWGDGLPRALGDVGASMALRSPTLLNVAWTQRLGWDGKFTNLESVAFAAITGAGNMNLHEAAAIERLAAIPGYVRAFAEAFGDPEITRRDAELALATYERTIVSGEAPFDRWIAGDGGAISEAAKRGFALFNGKAKCSACHSGWAFSDGSFHDIGTAEGGDLGRGRLFPTSLKLRYAFKTPTLRDVARRAPYMHDGSVPTLEAVIALYDRGGVQRPSRSELIRPLGLTEVEKADLIAFLRTLTSLPEPVPVPVLPREEGHGGVAP
ncbi:MAG TPA: cytochrome c peroxidase [Acetobacteraceae bacterium]|nr:cytochrome c peroxidase [Acetobacteraceae bacterium]